MMDALSALSLYRELEALDTGLSKIRGDDVTGQFMAAYTNQESFNHILKQVTEQCADSPEYLKSFSRVPRSFAFFANEWASVDPKLLSN
jgi:hypothetical protein